MYKFRFFLAILILFTLSACGGGGGTGTGSGQVSTEEGMAADTMGGTTSTGLQRRIVVIGDSIGTGFNASFAFPDLLQSLSGIEVINVSKAGSSADFGAGRASDLIAQFRPMYLVMLLGTNNAGGAGGGVTGAVNSLSFATNVAIEAGVIPIIGTIPPITNSSSENANVNSINAGILGISGARIARINRAISPSDITDGTHPNDRGQQIIAQLFSQQLF